MVDPQVIGDRVLAHRGGLFLKAAKHDHHLVVQGGGVSSHGGGVQGLGLSRHEGPPPLIDIVNMEL